MDFASALAFYESALASGDNPAAQVGWNAGEGYQLANFTLLCDLDDFVDGVSVLDVGCGLGALLDYFERIGRRVDYLGVDISAKMIDEARARHPGVAFELRDLLVDPPARRFDFVVCSGTLNRRIPEHARWMGDMISRMYDLADRALVFNVLNAAAVPSLRTQLEDQGEFVRMTPEELLRFCRRLTPDVALRDLWASTLEVILRRPRANRVAQLAERLRATEGPWLDCVVEIALRRRLHAELRDFLRTLAPNAYVLEHLAIAHAWLGERADAIAAYEMVAALAPENADPCTRIARIYFEWSRDADAQEWFRRALARDADAADARYGLVASLLRSGKAADARDVALATPPGPLRELLDGRTNADRDSALACYERALAAAPRSLDALLEVANAYENRSRWREAATLWQRALDITGHDDRIMARLMRAHSLVG